MKYYSLRILILFSFFANFKIFASGTIVGNGGDLVFYRADNQSDYSGYYTLDFLVTAGISINPLDALLPENQAQDLIETHLNATVPEIGEVFTSFRNFILNEDPAYRRFWRRANFGLVDLPDERLIELLPANCVFSGTDSKPKIFQAVIREARTNSVQYNYDPSLLGQLFHRPLQQSFLYVHEWLWDFANDARVIRDANRYFHSVRFLNASRPAVISALRNFGINIDSIIFKKTAMFRRLIQLLANQVLK